MATNGLSLKWKRPDLVEHPKVWHTFKAKDVDSDELVEYRIQDIPSERVDEVFEHMINNYIQDEPIGQALGLYSFPNCTIFVLFCYQRQHQYLSNLYF